METKKMTRKLLAILLATAFLFCSIEEIRAAQYKLTTVGQNTPTFSVYYAGLESRFVSYFLESMTAWNNSNNKAKITKTSTKGSRTIRSVAVNETWFGAYGRSGTNSNGGWSGFEIIINTKKTTEAMAQSVMVHEFGHALKLGDNPNNTNGQYDSSIMNYDRNRKTVKKPTSWDTLGVRVAYP